MEKIRKVRTAYIILAAALMIMGLIFIIRPNLSIIVICRLIGSLLAAYGVVKIIGYFSKERYQLAFQFDLAIGIFWILSGIILVWMAKKMIVILPIFVSLIILIDALFKIQISFDARSFGLKKWWLILILAVGTVILGIVLISYPQEAVTWIVRLIGLNLIFDGILNLWVAYYTVKTS